MDVEDERQHKKVVPEEKFFFFFWSVPNPKQTIALDMMLSLKGTGKTACI